MWEKFNIDFRGFIHANKRDVLYSELKFATTNKYIRFGRRHFFFFFSKTQRKTWTVRGKLKKKLFVQKVLSFSEFSGGKKCISTRKKVFCYIFFTYISIYMVMIMYIWLSEEQCEGWCGLCTKYRNSHTLNIFVRSSRKKIIIITPCISEIFCSDRVDLCLLFHFESEKKNKHEMIMKK